MTSHDAALREVRKLARTADREAIAGAFLSSLGQKPGPWRAPLGALAVASAVPVHRYEPFGPSSPGCNVCGLDPDVVAEPMRGDGQILAGDLATSLVVLRWAREEPAPAPTSADVKRFVRLLATVGELPFSAREGKLNDALRRSKLVLGNRYDVRSVIETLGACGILETPEHPGFTTKWTTYRARQARPSIRVECDPPIAFWRAGDGVSAKNVATWMGPWGVNTPKTAGARAPEVATADERDAKAKRLAARSTELEVGDVVAMKMHQWRAILVIGHDESARGRMPIVQRLAWQGAQMPTLADVKAAVREGAPGTMDLWKKSQGMRFQCVGRLPMRAAKVEGPLASYALARLGRFF